MTPILIDKRQLLYLKTILDRPNDDWTKQMLYTLKNNNIGWASQINTRLKEYGLEETWDKISQIPTKNWKQTVTDATERMNRSKLIDMCNGNRGVKTKTEFVFNELQSESYERTPVQGIFKRNRLEARTQIMSLCHMLNCANNYKVGNSSQICTNCNEVDDENHRINDCSKYQQFNLFLSPIKYDFMSIYSKDEETISRTIEVVLSAWNLANNKNEMRK